jgi:hypothetical protein
MISENCRWTVGTFTLVFRVLGVEHLMVLIAGVELWPAISSDWSCCSYHMKLIEIEEEYIHMNAGVRSVYFLYHLFINFEKYSFCKLWTDLPLTCWSAQ